MSNGKVWTDEHTQQLKEIHAAGELSLSQAAKLMGFGQSTVSERSSQMGLSWARTTQLSAAIETRRADAKARRLAFAESLMDDMEKLRDQLFAQTTVYNFGGRDNTFADQTLPQPPHGDQLKILQAISTAGATMERLIKLDSDSGVVEATGMLDSILDAIQKAADTPEALRAAGVEGAELL